MDKKSSRFSSLKYKLIAYFLIISLIPLILLGVISYSQVNRILKDQLLASAMNMAVKTMDNFDINSKYNEAILLNINNSSSVQQFVKMRLDPNSVQSVTYDKTLALLGSELESIIINGNMISCVSLLWSDGGNAMIRGSSSFNFAGDYRNSELYRQTVETTYKTRWKYVIVDEDMKYICVTRPLVDTYRGTIVGVIMINIFVQSLDEIFSNTWQNMDERNIVLDENDIVIFDSLGQLTGTKCEQEIVSRATGDSGSYLHVIGGEAQYVTYVTSRVTSWRLLNFIPYETIHKGVSNVSQTTLIITSLCILYAVLVAGFFYSNLYRPINMISMSLRKFGEGDLNVHLAETRKDEIGTLICYFNDMTVRIKELILNIEKEQKLQKEMEIRFLQAQITPHFLYNTLTSIKALARMGRNKEITEMVVALINLLRLLNSRKDMVSINDEITYVNNYVLIMKYRYGNYFDIVYDIEKGTENNVIPKLTLQPLVENCIIHAFPDKSKQYLIRITTRREGTDLIVEVADDGVGICEDILATLLQTDMTQSRGKFTSIGLYNISDRIVLNFGENYRISFNNINSNGVAVTIRLPLIREQDYNTTYHDKMNQDHAENTLKGE